MYSSSYLCLQVISRLENHIILWLQLDWTTSRLHIAFAALLYLLSYVFQPFFVERAFRIFDRDKNGSVSMAEFIDAMHQFAGNGSDEKLVFLFKVYDLDGELKFNIHTFPLIP